MSKKTKTRLLPCKRGKVRDAFFLEKCYHLSELFNSKSPFIKLLDYLPFTRALIYWLPKTKYICLISLLNMKRTIRFAYIWWKIIVQDVFSVRYISVLIWPQNEILTFCVYVYCLLLLSSITFFYRFNSVFCYLLLSKYVSNEIDGWNVCVLV